MRFRYDDGTLVAEERFSAADIEQLAEKFFSECSALVDDVVLQDADRERGFGLVDFMRGAFLADDLMRFIAVQADGAGNAILSICRCVRDFMAMRFPVQQNEFFELTVSDFSSDELELEKWQ